MTTLPSSMGWHTGPQKPAYHAVTARTTLSRPPPVTQMDDGKPKKVDWQKPVREYVRRAFEPDNHIEGISNDDMTAKLRQVISFFAERGMEDKIDWDTHPLPQQLIRDERSNNGASGFVGHQANHNTSPIAPQPPKRKSPHNDEDDSPHTPSKAVLPPWQKNGLEGRVTYGNGKEKRLKKHMAKDTSKFDAADLEKRKQRFQLEKTGNKTTPPWSSPRPDADSDMPTGPVVGTNLALEKSFFRLTAPPKAETVRPQHVLEDTLHLLTKKWKDDRNYNYICNQFKSLRQDLTVQHIKNAFTVSVYEHHARIALEMADLGEYNQCQTQLKALYMQGLGGHPGEFVAYRILYIVYTRNKTDMNDMLAELTPTDKTHPAVKHALDVRSSMALGNYHSLFKLYLEAPNMGAYLMDMFIQRERFNALANISKAYISVTLGFITNELGFENYQQCLQFLQDNGAQHIVDEKLENQIHTQTRVRVKEGLAMFEQLRAAAFSKVDIKGQI